MVARMKRTTNWEVKLCMTTAQKKTLCCLLQAWSMAHGELGPTQCWHLVTLVDAC